MFLYIGYNMKMCNSHNLRILEHKGDVMRDYDDGIPLPIHMMITLYSSPSVLYNILYVLTSSAIGYPMGIHSRSIVWSLEEVPLISKICTILCIFGVYNYVLSDDVNVFRMRSDHIIFIR